MLSLLWRADVFCQRQLILIKVNDKEKNSLTLNTENKKVNLPNPLVTTLKKPDIWWD